VRILPREYMPSARFKATLLTARRKDRLDLRFVPAVAKGAVGSSHGVSNEDLTLEVGKARIRIRPGFAGALLLQAVQAGVLG